MAITEGQAQYAVGHWAHLNGTECVVGEVRSVVLSESPYNPGWFALVVWDDGFQSWCQLDSLTIV